MTYVDPLPFGQVHKRIVVDNVRFLVDERSRARLDVSQLEIENGKVRLSNLTYPQGLKVALEPLSHYWLVLSILLISHLYSLFRGNASNELPARTESFI